MQQRIYEKQHCSCSIISKSIVSSVRVYLSVLRVTDFKMSSATSFVS